MQHRHRVRDKSAPQSGANAGQFAAIVEMSQSSKAGPHDPRPNRQRTRRAQREADIRDHS